MALVSTEDKLRSMSPGPERFMTMNLMSAGPCTVSKDFTSYGRSVRRIKTSDNHTTADVHGAQTAVRTSALNKPDSYFISDIEGTSCMRLHTDTDKPDRQLFHDDIDGSKPRVKSRFRTNRCVNPLMPVYALPSYVVVPNVSPKFTRDSYDVSDIEGTKSRPLYPLTQRNSYAVDDIEGAQAGWKPRHVRARRDAPPLDHSLNVGDITRGGFRTRRAIDPLTPSYRVNGMDIADDPVKSKPRALPKARDSPFYPLTTVDIEGAQPGWRPMPQMNPPLEARRHFRNTNFIGDIPGAQADTVKHSICTDRQVNPLNPVYASLDGEPLANPMTPLYKEPACIETIASEEAIATATVNGNDDVPARPECWSGNQRKSASISISTQDSRNQQQQQQQQEGELATSSRERPSSEPLPSSRPGENSCDSSRSNGSRRPSVSGAVEDFGGRGYSRAIDTPGNKDETIRRLEHEIRSLRNGGIGTAWPRDTSQLCDIDTTIGNIGGGRVTARSWPGSAHRDCAATNSRRIKNSGAHSIVQRRLPASSEGSRVCLKGTSGGGVPSAPHTGESRRIDERESRHEREGSLGGAMEIRCRGKQGDHGEAERLVLRSANGMSRVPLTPSERRVAREYVDDVSSVRNLL